MSIAKAIILGRVGKVNMHTTKNNKTIMELSVATDKKMQDNQVTLWHTVKIFGLRAEGLKKYVTTGTQLYLEGDLDISEWVDKDSGKKRFKTEILARDIQLLGTKRNDDENQNHDRAF